MLLLRTSTVCARRARAVRPCVRLTRIVQMSANEPATHMERHVARANAVAAAAAAENAAQLNRDPSFESIPSLHDDVPTTATSPALPPASAAAAPLASSAPAATENTPLARGRR